jgi:hypothetical protein
MRNFFLLLKYLIKSYDLLLNLLVHKQVQQLLLLNNLVRILGLNIEEDGDTAEDTVVDTEMVLGEMVRKEVPGVVEEVIMEVHGVVLTAILDIMVIMDILVMKDLLVLTGVLKEVMVVPMVVVEVENGDIMQRNLKNKRCVLLRKSR